VHSLVAKAYEAGLLVRMSGVDVAVAPDWPGGLGRAV
jgi:hypothetical protein